MASHHGWKLQPLEVLVELTRQVAQPSQAPPDTQYIGLEHVEPRTGYCEAVSLSTVNLRSAKFRFQPDDILFGKLRPNLRKVTVATCAGLCSTDLLPLRPRRRTMAFLIAYQLRSRVFSAQVLRLVAGQNLPRVAASDLLSIRVPTPPEGDAERLNEMAELLDKARRASRDLDRRVVQLHDAAAHMLYPTLEAKAD